MPRACNRHFRNSCPGGLGTATDKAGNSSTASVIVKLDKTPPSVTVTSPVSGTTVYTSPASVSGTVTDNLSGLAGITCDGTPAILTGSTFNCSAPLTASVNSIVKATDVAGNISTPPLSLTYSAPTVTITAPADLSFLNLSPTTVTGTVSDPTATVVINSIPASVANGSFSASIPLAEGPNILTASATSSGGAAATASITVTLDTTPPHVIITSPSTASRQR